MSKSFAQRNSEESSEYQRAVTENLRVTFLNNPVTTKELAAPQEYLFDARPLEQYRDVFFFCCFHFACPLNSLLLC